MIVATSVTPRPGMSTVSRKVSLAIVMSGYQNTIPGIERRAVDGLSDSGHKCHTQAGDDHS